MLVNVLAWDKTNQSMKAKACQYSISETSKLVHLVSTVQERHRREDNGHNDEAEEDG